jgi:hypothetical protein
VKVTGEPVAPVTVAVIVFVPTVAPRVQDPTVAMPEAFVVADRPVPEPPPEAIAKVTVAPGTRLPPESVRTTDGAVATAEPAVAVWPSPAFRAIAVAAPTVTVTDAVTGANAPRE